MNVHCTVLGVHKMCENNVKQIQWVQLDCDKIHNFTKKHRKMQIFILAAVYYFCSNWI